MMSTILSLVLAGLAGIGLGLFYLSGLWLTLQQLPTSRWPAPLALASFVVRTAIVVVGFYLVMGGRWERIVACLVGFTMVRLIVVSRLQTELMAGTSRGKDAV